MSLVPSAEGRGEAEERQRRRRGYLRRRKEGKKEAPSDPSGHLPHLGRERKRTVLRLHHAVGETRRSASDDAEGALSPPIVKGRQAVAYPLIL